MQNEYVILKSPVKIGDYDRVSSYAQGLTKGEEQLLITRDCKFYLTTGAGGYVEFKTINSGITMDQVNTLINDLDAKLDGDITTLENAVVSLGLEFDGYITKSEFEALALTVDSNTTLAAHDNRDVLDLFGKDVSNNPLYNGKRITDENSHTHDNKTTIDKFTEGTDGNPLYDGKQIVADFDSSAIEIEIANLNARSVIGGGLDFGLFGLSGAVTLGAGVIVPFNSTYSSFNLTISNGVVRLKKGKSYLIKTQAATQIAGSAVWFQIYDNTNAKIIGKNGWSGATNNASIPAIAQITCVTDIDICVKTSNAYNIDASCASMTYIEIEEISRTIIIDPAEDAKKIQFEYGDFRMSTDQTTNLVANGLILFDKLNYGNMSIANNKILLKADRVYEISASILGQGSGNACFTIYNETDSKILSAGYITVVTNTAGYSSSPNTSCIIKTTKDTYISIKFTSDILNIVKLYAGYASLIVKEIAQPYYFNYYKDSISHTTLFNGTANAVGTYILSDDITKYDHLVIYANNNNYVRTTHIVDCKTTIATVYEENISSYQNATCNFSILHHFDKDKLIIDWIGVGINWSMYPTEIFKIVGVGFNYDNPYRDIVSSVEDFTVTNAEADAAITDVWNEVGI